LEKTFARVREADRLGCTPRARDPRSITLMAVTKTVAPERIREGTPPEFASSAKIRVQEFAASTTRWPI